MGEEIGIRAVSLYSIRYVSDGVLKWLPHFISDPTIPHAGDGSPHADWIFERTVIVASGFERVLYLRPTMYRVMSRFWG